MGSRELVLAWFLFAGFDLGPVPPAQVEPPGAEGLICSEVPQHLRKAVILRLMDNETFLHYAKLNASDRRAFWAWLSDQLGCAV